jgi:hypothetical protein
VVVQGSLEQDAAGMQRHRGGCRLERAARDLPQEIDTQAVGFRS